MKGTRHGFVTVDCFSLTEWGIEKTTVSLFNSNCLVNLDRSTLNLVDQRDLECLSAPPAQKAVEGEL